MILQEESNLSTGDYSAEYEPEDGVFVATLKGTIQNALNEYALALSESVDKLSESEKRLAFAEYLINEGYPFRTDGDRFIVLGDSLVLRKNDGSSSD